MGAAFFYHLTESPLEATLPMLLNKARDAGWRIAVRGSDTAMLERLDTALWNGPVNDFLPHGIAGGAYDRDQPILLTSADDVAGFDCVMSVGGAELTVGQVETAQRCCVLFDGHDAMALETARGQWKALTDGGCPAQYWAQEDGRWIKKAETKA